MATSDAARYIGKANTEGSIRPANVADMVLLDADPIRDIKNTRRIAGVMLCGRWLDAQSLGWIRAAAASRAAKND